MGIKSFTLVTSVPFVYGIFSMFFSILIFLNDSKENTSINKFLDRFFGIYVVFGLISFISFGIIVMLVSYV